MMISLGHEKLDDILGGGVIPDTSIMVKYDVEMPVHALFFRYLLPSLLFQDFTVVLSIYGAIPYRRLYKASRILREKYGIDVPLLEKVEVIKVGGSSHRLFGKKLTAVPEGCDEKETIMNYITAFISEYEKRDDDIAVLSFGWNYFIAHHGIRGFTSLVGGMDLVGSDRIAKLRIHFYPEGTVSQEIQSIMEKIFDISFQFYRDSENNIRMEILHSLDPFVDLKSYNVTLSRDFELEVW